MPPALRSEMHPSAAVRGFEKRWYWAFVATSRSWNFAVNCFSALRACASADCSRSDRLTLPGCDMWPVGRGDSELHAARTAANRVIAVGIRLIPSPHKKLLMGELHSAWYDAVIVRLSFGLPHL